MCRASSPLTPRKKCLLDQYIRIQTSLDVLPFSFPLWKKVGKDNVQVWNTKLKAWASFLPAHSVATNK